MQCSVPQTSPGSNLQAHVGHSTLRAGWTQADRQMDVTHLTSGRHQSPSHTTGHFLASKPAFDLEFVIYHNHGEREEAQQVISWQGGGKNLFWMWHFCSALKAEAWRDACAKSMAFHIKPSRKRTPNPSCKHRSMARWWKSHNCNTLVLLLLSSCSVTWFGFKEKKYESNHLSITLSQRKFIPYSLEKQLTKLIIQNFG